MTDEQINRVLKWQCMPGVQNDLPMIIVSANLFCDRCRIPYGKIGSGSACQSHVLKQSLEEGWVKKKTAIAMMHLCPVCKDYQPSEREQIAIGFAHLIESNDLKGLDVDGVVYFDDSGERPFYSVLFSKAGNNEISGQVDVYGPKFIKIQYASDEHSGHKVFDSNDNASQFFMLAIILRNWVESSHIPTKPENKNEGVV